jgi:hypothetical protein
MKFSAVVLVSAGLASAMSIPRSQVSGSTLNGRQQANAGAQAEAESAAAALAAAQQGAAAGAQAGGQLSAAVLSPEDIEAQEGVVLDASGNPANQADAALINDLDGNGVDDLLDAGLDLGDNVDLGDNLDLGNVDLGNVDLGDLDLGNLDAGNLDLGNLDLGDNVDLNSLFDVNNFDFGNLGGVDLVGAISLLLGSMGLGGFFDFNLLGGLGNAQELALFLQLQQLQQLQLAGFVNQFDILALLNQGSFFNGINIGKELTRQCTLLLRQKLTYD